MKRNVAGLLVMAVAAVAFLYLVFTTKPTQPNHTMWFAENFTRNISTQLSQAQKDIIHNSATITSAVAEDAGVKITLDAVMGNGYVTYYKLDMELPEGIQAEDIHFFEDKRLRLNDDSIGIGNRGGSVTFGSNYLTDHGFFLIMSTRLGYTPYYPYSFDNGIVRTLHLENMMLEDENGKRDVIEGQWDLGVLFHDKGEAIELIQEPVTVRGWSDWHDAYYKANITSFILTEFSAYCQYEMLPSSKVTILDINPIAVMKDGRSFCLRPGSGSNTNTCYRLRIPISLDEVDYIQLTEQVHLPVNYKISSLLQF